MCFNFRWNIVPPSWFAMERKPQYKKSLLEYFGVNSLLFNESSIGEVLGYLSQAIAGERFDRQAPDTRNSHHHQTMKAVLLVLFLKSHEQYAYASRKCLLDVVSQNFAMFMRAILPVRSRSYQGRTPCQAKKTGYSRR